MAKGYGRRCHGACGSIAMISLIFALFTCYAYINKVDFYLLHFRACSFCFSKLTFIDMTSKSE